MYLSQNEKNSISKILIEGDIKRAALFGSYARGDATENSDIDILIEFNGNKKSLLDLVELRFQLQETVGKNIDLMTYNSLHPLLRDHILSEQVVIL